MPVITEKDIIFTALPPLSSEGGIIPESDIIFGEDSWANVVGKGLMRGVAGTARGIGELMSLPGRALGYSGGAWDYVRKAGKEAEEYWKPEVAERGAKYYVGEAARTIGHMGSAAASGGATRILPVISSLAGGTKAGEILDEGHPISKALIGGLTQAGLEYTTEKMPMDILLKPGVNFLARLAKGMAYDIPGELAATAGEMALIDENMLGKNYSAEQYKQALIDTAIVSGLVTGGATTISHPLANKQAPAAGKILSEQDIVFAGTEDIITEGQKHKAEYQSAQKAETEQPLSEKDKLIQEIYDKANEPIEPEAPPPATGKILLEQEIVFGEEEPSTMPPPAIQEKTVSPAPAEVKPDALQEKKEEIEQPVIEGAEKPVGAMGKPSAVSTERGTKVDTAFAIVGVNELSTSHNTALNKNKSYPDALQPRQRERGGSQVQIDNIINHLEPEFLGESPKASEGAPIVGKDLIVESGNGRIIALKKSYDGNHPNSIKYKQWLIDNAERFGISKADIEKVNNPVLVRVRQSDVDRINFVKEANEQAVAAMSTTEQAMSDAKALAETRTFIEMPEIVELAKELSGGRYPRIRKMLRAAKGQALSVFYAKGNKAGSIELKADIFKDITFAAKVLAHEIGHLVDYLPHQHLKRGNILGSIASLKKYMKSMLEEFPDSPDTVITAKERNKIRKEATKEVVKENGKSLTAFRNDKAFRDSVRDQISARTKEKIAGIAKKRGLFTRQEIMDELKAITQFWKPFDETDDKKFTLYRYSPRELYADAFSVLINDPKLLSQAAPKFDKAFFNWIQKKPDVKAVYEDIQSRLHDKEKVLEKRSEDVRKGFKNGEEAKKRSEQARRKPLKIIDDIKRALVDVNTPIIRRVKQLIKAGKKIQPEDNPVYWVEELPYVSGEVYNHLKSLEDSVIKPAEKAGISLDDIGEYMLFKRIATERAEIANPWGHTKETAEKQLDALKQQLGDERYAQLEGYGKKYWDLRQENIIPLLEKAGMYSDELMQKIKDNENYATFDIVAALEKRYGRNISGYIHKQIGTLHEVRNPFVATVMKDAALIRAAEVNMTKEKTVDFLNAHYPVEIKPADTRWNGKYQEPVLEPKDPEQGSIVIMKNGKLEAYYIPKEIAAAFKRDPYEADIILRVWQAVNVPLRMVLVSKNPIWMAANIIRDAIGTIKHIPGMTAPKLIKYYAMSYKDAYKDAYTDKPVKVVSDMLKNKMLVVDRQYGAKDIDGETELDRLLQSFGKSPVQYRNKVIKPFARFWDYDILGRTGKFTERWAKIAGYKYLQAEESGKRHEKEIAHIVRTRIGTPDIYRRGAWNAITNNIFLFSNVAKEGWRASWEAAKESPATYGWKTVKWNLLPKLIVLAGLAGWLGDEIKEILERISNYDKENYTVIPIGLTEGGKGVYFRIPQDYAGQVIGGLFWNLVNGKITGKGSAFSYATEQSPYGLNPYLTVAVDFIKYMQGKNPYDDFRGDNLIDDKTFKAGGWRSHKEMAKHTWRELGGSVIYKFQKGEDVEKVKSELEKTLGFPPGNILGRFLKISDTGVREELREVTEKAAKKTAQRQLAVKDRIIESIDLATKEGRKATVSEMISTYRDLIRNDLIDPTATSPMQFRHTYNRYAGRVEKNAYIDAVINAATNDEKAALLRTYKKKFSAEEYKEIARHLLIEGHITKGALIKEALMEEEQ